MENFTRQEGRGREYGVNSISPPKGEVYRKGYIKGAFYL